MSGSGPGPAMSNGRPHFKIVPNVKTEAGIGSPAGLGPPNGAPSGPPTGPPGQGMYRLGPSTSGYGPLPTGPMPSASQGGRMDTKPVLSSNGAPAVLVGSSLRLPTDSKLVNGGQVIVVNGPGGPQPPQPAAPRPHLQHGARQPNPHQPQAQHPQPPFAQAQLQAGPPGMDQQTQKCLSFLRTLIKLSSKDGVNSQTHQAVVRLVQDLVSGSVAPEAFTQGVQRELKSNAQPHLIPFLQRALPSLRNAVRRGEALIDGVSLFVSPPRPTQPPAPQPPASPLQGHQYAQPPMRQAPRPPVPAPVSQPQPMRGPSPVFYSQQGQPPPGPPRPTFHPPSSAPQPRAPLPPGPHLGHPPPGQPGTSMPSALSHASHLNAHMPRPSTSGSSMGSGASTQLTPEKVKTEQSGGAEDDINDVAAMGGVNLQEESRNLATGLAGAAETRSLGGPEAEAEEELSRWFSLPAIRQRVAERSGLGHVSRSASLLMGLALQRRLTDWLERLAVLSQHRADNLRRSGWYEAREDLRPQLRWVEDVDRAEGARREERDKEILLKLSKSKTSGRLDEAESERLKAKAKELQKLEEEQSRNRDANAAAQLALSSAGRKRAWDGAAANAGGSGSGASASPGPSAASGAPSAPPAAGGSASAVPGEQLRLLRTQPQGSSAAPSARVTMKDVQAMVSEMADARASRLLYRRLLKPSQPPPPAQPPD